MTISPENFNSGIAAAASLLAAAIGALVSWIVARLTAKNEIEKLKYNFLERLYEKRLESYVELLSITQEIGKDAKNIALHENARAELKKWQTETCGFLLFSRDSLAAFNELKDLLAKNPEKGNEYSQDQRQKLFYARNSLRGTLRSDFEFFHHSEKQAKKSTN